jgi:hypothetical protein
MARDGYLVSLDDFKKDSGGILNSIAKKITNKLEDKLENAVEDLFAKALKKVGFSDATAAKLSARFGDSLTAGLEDKYFQTFTSEMKRASCADIKNNFNPQNGNIIGASAFAETYVDAIQRASNNVTIDGLDTMQFPDHISENYYMSFKFKQYQRPSPHTKGELKFVQAFALPLPKGIRESFDIEVAPNATGLKGGIADAMQNFIKSDDGKERTQAITNSVAALAFSAMVQSTGDVGALGAQAIGAVPNPHIQALFSGVPLRTHRFEWTFAPRNPEESQQLMNLLKAMKAYALPSYSSLGTAALAYPFLCQPELRIMKGEPGLIQFMPCLIQSIELNYSPQGIPAFFEGTSHPAFIECSMTMLETQIQTSRDYGREGGDRLSESFETFKTQIQKGINAAGLEFDINKTQADVTGYIEGALSNKEEKKPR